MNLVKFVWNEVAAKCRFPPILGAICFKFPLPAGACLAQSVERKALNPVVIGSSPPVGGAAGPTQ